MAIKQKPEYVVVTCVSTFRNRYVIPVDELQRMNPDEPVDPSWALDAVTCQDVKEFSQRHVGEQIIDAQVLREPEVLQFFDADNDYLSGWEEEFKLAWIKHWKEKPSPEEEAEFDALRQSFLADKIDELPGKMSHEDEMALQEYQRAQKMVDMEEGNKQFAEDLANGK